MERPGRPNDGTAHLIGFYARDQRWDLGILIVIDRTRCH